MSKTKKKPKLIEHEGKLYLPLSMVVSTILVALHDNLPIARFPGEKEGYLEMEEGIRWLEKEINYSAPKHKAQYRERADLMKKILEKYRSGGFQATHENGKLLEKNAS